jgi:uncharacterized protein (TIGR02466 family)
MTSKNIFDEAFINGIFQIPIYIIKIKKNFTNEELKFVDNIKNETYKNIGNKTSLNTYVLEESIFKNLKEILNLKVQDYFDKVLLVKKTIKPYITQSWLNFTKTKEYHHEHFHKNSIISGVLYFDAEVNFDKIIFTNPLQEFLDLDITNFNVFNSEQWTIPVETGLLIMFPSYLQHRVETKIGNNLRTSLSFNVFVKGVLGINSKLTELVIK